MSSAPTDCRVPDPSDKLDAKADGQFQAVNRRAGYGDDRLDRIIATARKGWTLAAGEGLVLVQEIDRLRGELELVSSEAAEAYHAIDRRDEELAQQSITLSAEHQRAERILAALREPSREMREAVHDVLNARKVTDPIIGEDIDEIIEAAVAAAEQEVANDEG